MKRAAIDTKLPPLWPEKLEFQLQEEIKACARKLIVLNDDPTGGQTAHDINEWVNWESAPFREILIDQDPATIILTNTRSIPPEKAAERIRILVAGLAEASKITGVDFDLVMRGDSTLRGHFPLELDTARPIMERNLNFHFDGIIFCPALFEAGRLTFEDLHWVTKEDLLVPVGETEFARDAIFGYQNSNLRAWVKEKTKRQFGLENIFSISLESIRKRGPEGIRNLLQNKMGAGKIAVVNAVDYRDLHVFVLGLLRAQQDGMRFLFNTAASFVKVRAGIPDRPLLSSEKLSADGNKAKGGLMVVGSYLEKTTRQLQVLMKLERVEGIELKVDLVLDASKKNEVVKQIARRADTAIASGNDAIIYTSRNCKWPQGKAGEFHIGHLVSNALTDVVQAIQTQPRFLIAKGGITSSDVAVRGLHAQCVRLMGQAFPGMPVWRLGPETTFPNHPYIVVPGNVGDDGSLAQILLKCRA